MSLALRMAAAMAGGSGASDPYWANVSLLLHGDGSPGGTIIDSKNGVTVTKVGNADISVAQVKYGSGCLGFDGTGDAVTVPKSANFDLGSGDFTIEFWLYRIGGTDKELIAGGTNGGSGYPYIVYVDSSGRLVFYCSATNSSWFAGTPVVGPTIGNNAWHHCAVTRFGNLFTIWYDGVSSGSATLAVTIANTTDAFSVGGLNNGANCLTGYMDDIRITKGVARYSSTFIPPTTAFPNL